MNVVLDPSSIDDYRMFLRIKSLPVWSFQGREAWFPDEYASRLGIETAKPEASDWTPPPFHFDYQAAITRMAIEKRKFCIFADCGLGKTLMFLSYAEHAAKRINGKGLLIVSPLMVVPQTLSEAAKWYPHLSIEFVPAKDLADWLTTCGGKIGITNYDAIRDELTQGQLGGLILDESSMLKSQYGKWGTKLIELGRGLEWKLACTGTPAPNDRIEYGNHAVFMDRFPTLNSFLAQYFINRGQTQERWVLKDHAIGPFFKSLSHWSIFLTNPATYGWTDGGRPPAINVTIHHVDITTEQRTAMMNETGMMIPSFNGGIGGRGKMSQLAKGRHNGKDVKTLKPDFIRDLIATWPTESTIVWCHYNPEQDHLETILPGAASISGKTPHEERMRIIDAFKAGTIKTLISKPKILGFGLNLQVATRHVFSGLQDSYESYYQAVKRSNRYGSTVPLNVHIPITDLEEPLVQNVLRKAAMVQHDTEVQEQLFKDVAI